MILRPKTLVQTVNIPDPGCTGGTYRPFGLKYHDGKLFVGVVCDGSVSQNQADMDAFVYAYDGTAFSEVLSFPLDYARQTYYNGAPANFAKWLPWRDTDLQARYSFGRLTVDPQPIIADIEFDVITNGMIIGLMDRFGHIGGNGNYDQNGSSTYTAIAVGDIRYAYPSGINHWTIESGGDRDGTGPYIPRTDQVSPPNAQENASEFYRDDLLPSGVNQVGHRETLAGGLMVMPLTNQVDFTAMDPADHSNTGGTKRLNNSDGSVANTFEVFTSADAGTLGKANGLGDLELLCDPAPIQIGNRVWRDDNANGIQDPCEPAIPGAVVTLYNAAKTTALASVTTNAAGEYYFSSANITAGNSSSSLATTALTYNTGYAVVVTSLGSSTVVTGLSLTNVSPVTPGESSTANSGTTQVNNDAMLVSGKPCIELTTGGAGSTNHTYDFGLVVVPCSLSLTAIAGNCDPATNQYTLTGTLSLTGNSTGGTATLTDGFRSVTLTVPANATSVAYSLTGLIADGSSHTVTVNLTGCSGAPVSYMAPASCTVAAAIVVTSATVCYGSSATLTASGCTGTVTWWDNTTGSSLITPNLTATTNYTATCTTSTGSATFAVGTVTVMPQPVLSLAASATNVTVGTPVSLSAIGCVGTVSWSTGQNGNTISVTPSQPGQTYSATCVTGPGCVTTASVLVNTQPSASLVVISATVCYGSSATLTASGCTNGTVTWSNNTTGSSLIMPNLTATTNYTATCTTQTGSTTFAVGTVTVMPQPVLSLQASATNVTVSTPVSLSAIGCVGTLTWSTGQNGNTTSVTPSQPTQTYSATCVTGPGCQTTASVTVNTQPSASLVVISATVCYGSSATLTASGCTNGTVTWSNNTTGSSLIMPNLTATTNYTATCITQTGSTTFAVGTVTVMPQPVLSLAASATNVTVGTPVSLSAIGCVGTVSWSTGGNGNTISVTPSQPGQTYSTTCVTGPGCVTTASVLVNTQPSASLVVVSATVCYGSSATLTASGCANGTVTWSNNTTGSSLMTPNLTATTNYTATCITQTGSTTFAAGTVTVMPQPVLSLAASAANVTVGTPVSLSAIGCAGTLTWSTGGNGNTISVTPSQPGQTYSATCVTGPGCVTTASVLVNTQPSASLVVISATVCYGSSATLTASGCTNGTVTWSNNTTGSSLITPNLTATTNYTATCTTSTGSTTFAMGMVTVMPQPVLSLAASATNVTVGTPVSLSAIGCVGTLTWSTGQNGAVISVTPSQPGQTYSATCVTGPGCQTTASVLVNTQPSASLVVISATVCYGSSATLTASGCTNGTVTWSNNTTGSSLITPNLTATTNYTATCTTSTGSTTFAMGMVTVMPQPVLSLAASATNVTVGTPVSLSAIGCVGTLTWSTGQNGAVISVTPSQPGQTYSATCVTGPGCQTTASVTVNTQPSASLVVVSATVCYGSSATLTASGCANGTVTWSNSTTGSSLMTPNLTATTNYTATCITQTGSTTFAVGTVTVMPQPVLSLQASATNVTVGTPVSLSAIGCVGHTNLVNGWERQYHQRNAVAAGPDLQHHLCDGSGLCDDGFGASQYPTIGESCGDFGDGMLRQFCDADRLGLHGYRDLVGQHNGQQPDNAESDSNDELYSDLHDLDGLSHLCGGHGNGDAAAGAEPDGPERNTKFHHAGGQQLRRFADVVNRTDLRSDRRFACADSAVLGHLYHRTWLYSGSSPADWYHSDQFTGAGNQCRHLCRAVRDADGRQLWCRPLVEYGPNHGQYCRSACADKQLHGYLSGRCTVRLCSDRSNGQCCSGAYTVGRQHHRPGRPARHADGDGLSERNGGLVNGAERDDNNDCKPDGDHDVFCHLRDRATVPDNCQPAADHRADTKPEPQ